MAPEHDITRLLDKFALGDTEAGELLLPVVYNELHRIAARHMSSEREGHTLQPTALVNEAYMRLASHSTDWKNRTHFFAVAAKMMRQILVDHGRQKVALKRGGRQIAIEFVEGMVIRADKTALLISLDAALDRLEAMDPRQAKVVEMRFFAGLTEDEIARLLGVTSRTIKRDWKMAKAWMKAELLPG